MRGIKWNFTQPGALRAQHCGTCMTIKAVLFDIDGTLVDSNDQHVQVWQAVFAAAGHDFSWQVLHDQIGKGADMLVPTLLPGSDAAAAKAYGEAHGKAYKAQYLNAVQPFAGAPALLQRVHAAGQQVVLASSASQAELDHYTGLLGAKGLLAATTCADDVAASKPAPDIFATALAKLAPLTAAEVIVVGDTPYDIQAAKAAKAAGIAAIGVRSGKFPDAVLLEAGAVALYDDTAALLAGYDGSPLAA